MFYKLLGIVCWIVCCVMFTTSAVVAELTDDAPVFIWSSESYATFPEPPELFADNVLSDEAFKSQFLSHILSEDDVIKQEQDGEQRTSETIVVFVQNELSEELLTRGSDAFGYHGDGGQLKHLKNLMLSHKSLYLPLVTSAADTIQKWLEAARNSAQPDLLVLEINDPFSQSEELNEKLGQPAANRVIVIQIPSLNDVMDLKQTDDVIDHVMSHLIESGENFVAIYTSRYFTAETPEVGGGFPPGAGGRKLLQYLPTNFTFVNLTNCVYLYVQSVNVSVAGYRVWTLPLEPVVDSWSYCANYSALLSVSYFDVDTTLQLVNFEFIFGVTTGLNGGYWYLTNFTLSYSIFSPAGWNNATIPMFPYFVTETPYGFSYSCYELPNIKPLWYADVSANQTANVTFTGLQIQAFNISGDQFGYYNDCVGFFTITTWACLITVFIMAAILLFAACMFYGLETQDRFDDPRGKTITVIER